MKAVGNDQEERFRFAGRLPASTYNLFTNNLPLFALEVQIFTPAHSEENIFVTQLLEEERAMVLGIVLSELIQCTRSAQEREQLHDTLNTLPYLEITAHP